MCALQTTFGLNPSKEPLIFKIFGIGGAGCNFVAGTKLPSVAIGSTAGDLERCQRAEKIVISSEQLVNFALTEPSMLSKSIIPQQIRDRFEECEISILIAGLGGITGSHGIRFLATVAKILGKNALCISSLPFSVESETRRNTASEAMRDIAGRTGLFICFENDKLKDLVPKMPIDKAFKIMNSIMERPILDLSRVMTKADIPVMRQVASKSGSFRLGVGLGRGTYRDRNAIREAFESPWFDFDLKSAPSAFAIISSHPVDEREVEDVIKEIHDRLPNSKLMIGSYEDPSLEDRLRISLLIGKPKS